MSFRVPYRPTVSFSTFVLQRGYILVFLAVCLGYLLQDGSLGTFFGLSFRDAAYEHRICMDVVTKKPMATVYKYVILIDAGSTGTRLHVYGFEYCGEQLFSLASEVFKEIPIGVATLAHNLSDIEPLVLRPLMTTALQSVPTAQLSCTLVAIKATAGLRLLEADQVAQTLDVMRVALKKYPFRLAGKIEADAVSVISGQEEGSPML